MMIMEGFRREIYAEANKEKRSESDEQEECSGTTTPVFLNMPDRLATVIHAPMAIPMRLLLQLHALPAPLSPAAALLRAVPARGQGQKA